MSRAGKYRRHLTHANQLNSLETFKALAKRLHDALYLYSQESNWVMDDSLNAIWIGEGKGPQLAQDVLKGQ